MSSIPCPVNLSAPPPCRWTKPPQHPALHSLARSTRKTRSVKARVLSGERRIALAEQEPGREDRSGVTRSEQDAGLPEYESYDDRSFFPKRQPGSFPSPEVRNAFRQFRHELVNGAATGSFDEGDETEFDPLRDGNARYLGYTNELG
jgi:hypothetical protein